MKKEERRKARRCAEVIVFSLFTFDFRLSTFDFQLSTFDFSLFTFDFPQKKEPFKLL